MHYFLADQDGGKDRYYWMCPSCSYRTPLSDVAYPDDTSCPDCEGGTPGKYQSARRERQRLAWIQFMQGMMGNIKSMADNKVKLTMEYAMEKYNERWEQDD